jgi:hypothetical protein
MAICWISVICYVKLLPFRFHAGRTGLMSVHPNRQRLKEQVPLWRPGTGQQNWVL